MHFRQRGFIPFLMLPNQRFGEVLAFYLGETSLHKRRNIVLGAGISYTRAK
jgi:hypothetical protein